MALLHALPGCRHALCGAHLLRELTFFEELSEETKAWPSHLKELLLGMKGEAEEEGDRRRGGSRR